MPYVDGFVIPVAKDKVEVYKAHAKKAGEVWMEHGALAFVECVRMRSGIRASASSACSGKTAKDMFVDVTIAVPPISVIQRTRAIEIS